MARRILSSFFALATLPTATRGLDACIGNRDAPISNGSWAADRFCECYAEEADPGNQCGGQSFFGSCDTDQDDNGVRISTMCDECGQCSPICSGQETFRDADFPYDCSFYGLPPSNPNDPDCDTDVDDAGTHVKRACSECGFCLAPTPSPTPKPDCQGDPDTWSHDGHHCVTYDVNHMNYQYCADHTSENLTAAEVCPQCGVCQQKSPDAALDSDDVTYKLEMTAIVAGVVMGGILDTRSKVADQLFVHSDDVEIIGTPFYHDTIPPTAPPTNDPTMATTDIFGDSQVDSAAENDRDGKLFSTARSNYAIAHNKVCSVSFSLGGTRAPTDSPTPAPTDVVGEEEEEEMKQRESLYGRKYTSRAAVAEACDLDMRCSGFFNSGYLNTPESAETKWFKCERVNDGFNNFPHLDPQLDMPQQETPEIYYKVFYDCGDVAEKATLDLSTTTDKEDGNTAIKINGDYWLLTMPLDGSYEIVEAFCKFDRSKNFAWTLIESVSKKDNAQVADAAFNVNVPIGGVQDLDNAFRMSRKSMIALERISDHVAVECNWPDVVETYGRRDPPRQDDLEEIFIDERVRRSERSTRDSAWWKLSAWNPMTHSNGERCIEVEYVDIRGNYCDTKENGPCKVRVQCEANEHCHIVASPRVGCNSDNYIVTPWSVPLGGYQAGQDAVVCRKIQQEWDNAVAFSASLQKKCEATNDCVHTYDGDGLLTSCEPVSPEFLKCRIMQAAAQEAHERAIRYRAFSRDECIITDGCTANLNGDGELDTCTGVPIVNEDAFGYYANGLDDFQCWRDDQSTTQWYFGRSLVEPTPMPTMMPTTIYNFEGCFNEDVDDRAFSHSMGKVNYDFYGSDSDEHISATRECAIKCAGWDYFGIQGMWDCHCGTSGDFDKHGVADQSNAVKCSCDSWYVGKPSTICGYSLNQDVRVRPDGCTVMDPCNHGGGPCNFHSQCVMPAVCKIPDGATEGVCTILPAGETKAPLSPDSADKSSWAVTYAANLPNKDACEYKVDSVKMAQMEWEQAFAANAGISLHIISMQCSEEYPSDDAPVVPETTHKPTPSPTTAKPFNVCSHYQDRIQEPVTAYVQTAFSENTSSCRNNEHTFIPEEYQLCPGERTATGGVVAEIDERAQNKGFIKCLENIPTRPDCERWCSRSQLCQGYEWQRDHPRFNCILIYTSAPFGNDSGSGAECWAKDFSQPRGSSSEIANPIRPVCINRFAFHELSREMMLCYCKNQYGRLDMQREPSSSYVCPSKIPPKENDHQRRKREADDLNEDRLIQAAQANRMFRKCNAWCLYDADRPSQKAWIWRAKKACWQKQGQHGMCLRKSVLEIEFAADRSTKFCGDTSHPTNSPTSSAVNVHWRMTDASKPSCTAACEADGYICNPKEFGPLMNSQKAVNELNIIEIYELAGQRCDRVEEGTSSHSGPLHKNGRCILRDEGTTMDLCGGTRSWGYERLCPCT